MAKQQQPKKKPPVVEAKTIPKKPNLLNNLLKRHRQQAFPERSIAYAAKKMGIEPAYLVKVESGDLEKPNDDTFPILVKWYCNNSDWAKTLTWVKSLANAGELHSDDLALGVGRSARLNPEGKSWITIFGPGYQLNSMDELLTGAAHTYVAVECLASLMIAVPGSAPVLASMLKTAAPHLFCRGSSRIVLGDARAQPSSLRRRYTSGVRRSWMSMDTYSERVLRG